MKKISLILSIVFFLGIFQANSQQSWNGLQKDKVSSDKKINHKKKGKKPKTWINRGKLYFDIYVFQMTGLQKGLAATEGIYNVKTVIGEPLKKEKNGNNETWIYKHKKLFIENGKLSSWKFIDYIDKDALKKSGEAFLKSDELDAKHKYKKRSSTMESVKYTRDALENDAINKYQEQKFKEAYDLMKLNIQLGEVFPKSKTDTTFVLGAAHYKAGIIASNGKLYDEATEHFQISIKENYEPGVSYHYVADAKLKKGDSTAYINTVKEGFEKYPNTELLINDLINYYMQRDELKTAVEYLDLGIKKNPKNHSYYSAKATIYDNQNETKFVEYKKIREEQLEFKKKAYRDRKNKKLEAEDLDRMKQASDKADAVKVKMNETFKDATELYNQSLSIKKDFFKAEFNLGRIYYKQFERKRWESEFVIKIIKNKTVAFAKSDEFIKESKNDLKNSAEHFEKAHIIDTTNKTTLEILRKVYYLLKNKDKVKECQEKINKLEAKAK